VALDGTKTERSWFTSGPANGQTRKEEQVLNRVKKVVRQCSYDENGKLIREVNSGTAPILFKYDEKGRQIGAILDGKNLWSRTFDSKGRIKDEVLENGTFISYLYHDENSYEKKVLEKNGSRFVQTYRGDLEIRREMENGSIENYEYDNKGRLSGITDEKKERRDFNYAKNGEIIEEYRNKVLYYKVFTTTSKESRLKVIYDQYGTVVKAWDWVKNKEYHKISAQDISRQWIAL
jgi:YD repeat-containing protein